ncbi:hypothetical protein BJV74DRAFT_861927, partial [Russula compacta]
MQMHLPTAPRTSSLIISSGGGRRPAHKSAPRALAGPEGKSTVLEARRAPPPDEFRFGAWTRPRLSEEEKKDKGGRV